MNRSKGGPGTRPSPLLQFGLLALCLVVILGVLFRDGLGPGRIVFSNDGPLGAISTRAGKLPSGFLGFWLDLNWLGNAAPSASPDLSATLSTVVGPLMISKIYAPFALLFLGMSAWLCFRQWKLSPLACALGAIAAALNSDFFSTACWGVASQPICFGLNFLALAALADETSPRRWLRVMLAGFAVGLGVMEAFDIGAIFSIVVAAFALFQALVGAGGMPQRVVRAATRLGVVAGCAAQIAASAVVGLVKTQIQGVAGMGQDVASKARRWDEATQWSLPKAETLSLVVPGLFGYRMDTPQGLLPESLQEHYQGGQYWGRCGRDPAWDRYFAAGKKGPPPAGFIRYGGGGLYVGVGVMLIALWAVGQMFRKQNSVFCAAERKQIAFWSGVALLSGLVGLGRFAPFYQLFYGLPFASTMRNPAKFFHVVEWALLILFAYGVNGLSRGWLEAPAAATRGLSEQLKAWWSKAAAYDRNWVKGSLAAVAASLLGWWAYAAWRDRLVAYLQEVDFDAATAKATAAFSIREVGWFVLFLTLGVALVALILSGYFKGRRARAAGILLGLLLAIDLGRADLPWVITWNWVQKYASNPVIDFLREKPYEHRVAMLPFPVPQELSLFTQLYNIEWLQQIFQYYNVQSLDQIMNPRPRQDEIAFKSALYFDRSTNTVHRIARYWELTNTRYLLGPTAYLDVLNQQVDPVRHRFRIAATFELAAKPGIANPVGLEELTAVISTNGPFAVFDFTGALPRAKLYAHWQVRTNDQAALAELASAGFDPQNTVLVADALPAASPAGTTDPSGGTVTFVSYAPKRIELQAEAARPAVLLLNDRFDSNWKVSVDGKPEKLLRCNYLMRGVYLQAGAHAVEFRFAPALGPLYVSIGAVVVGLCLCGFLALCPPRQPSADRRPSSARERR